MPSSSCTVHRLHGFMTLILRCMCLLYLLRTVGVEISAGTFAVGSTERVWETSNLVTEEYRSSSVQ